MNIPFFLPSNVSAKVPVDPPPGTGIPISDELHDLIIATAVYMGTLKEFSPRAHEVLTEMAEATPVKLEDASTHAIKPGGVEPILVTLGLISAGQHAIGIMNDLIEMSGDVD